MEYWDAQALEQRRAASLEQRQPIAVFRTAWEAWFSVLGDPIGFLSRTWVYIVLIALLLAWGDHETRRWHEAHRDNLFSIFSLLVLAPVAVLWHRRVLIDEQKHGVFALRFMGREVVFLFTLVGFELFGLSMPAIGGAAAWMTTTAGGSPHLGTIAAIVACCWLIARLLLVLPLQALDQANSFSVSFSLTKGRALRILGVSLLVMVPMLLFAIPIMHVYELRWQPMEVVVGRAFARATMMVVSACVVAASLSLLMKALGRGFLPNAVAEVREPRPDGEAARP